MKKAILISMIAILAITGCENKKITSLPEAKTAGEEQPAIPDGVDVVIREKLFIGQVNDVYRNPNEYLGKVIKLEGIFMGGSAGGRDYCYVIRKGPGCCGDDGQVGFEVSWNLPGSWNPPGSLNPPSSLDPDQISDVETKAYPKTNDWVEAQGELKRYEQNGYSFLYLSLTELKTMEKRGAEFVLQ